MASRRRSSKLLLFTVPHSIRIFIFLCLCIGNTLCVYYADNGLEQTLAYKFLPAKERREMQQEILNLLGLQHRPKPKTHAGTDNSAPKYLQDLYESLLDEESGNLKVDENQGPIIIEGEVLSKMSLNAINDSDVIMSFVNQFSHRYPHSRHDRDKRFWFDISEVLPSQTIMEAELRLYRNLTKSKFDRQQAFNATIYLLADGEDSEDKVVQFVDSQMLEDKEGWIMFNVTAPMISWVAFPSSNLGLYLSIKSNDLGK
ncbi:bone morphogenetic protein 7-like isoform X1 [Dinothrombium tinctorium]|uniref:Bone morphogenetic protein 7-like isoform X1 n=1 Tax=Dinothrombium tinctorium TaxID=1965070 RepID=A0A443RDP7_9ACAR|nr:bone morphogenetic protein 7-like isoform X1 [Dinothrombium tinctorium]RWS13380.1 bone morphogenetic protein 7-like isoform X1 [Dinothrombium tinctorium]